MLEENTEYIHVNKQKWSRTHVWHTQHLISPRG